jgi:serine/threonine protein phosphatase 1
MTDSMPKIFAVGDIHGCYDKLTTLLGRIPFDRDRDTLIFLGDYINRGPDSRKVLDHLIRLKKECRNVVYLVGNHEHTLLEYSVTGDMESLKALRMMGLEATLQSYGSSIRHLPGLACFPEEHRDFLRSLDFAFIDGRNIFTHADISRKSIELCPGEGRCARHDHPDEAALLFSRRLVRKEAETYGYTIIFGHSPVVFPLVLPNRIGIDTGAVYGNVLTAFELPGNCFHHA